MKKEWNYLYAFLVFILTGVGMILIAILFLTVTMIAGGLAAGEVGMDLVEDLYGTSYYEYLDVVCYTTVGAPFIIWYCFSFRRREQRPFQRIGGRLSPVSFLWTGILAVGLSYFARLIMFAIALVNPIAVESYDNFAGSVGMQGYSLMWVFTTLVLAPIVEETIFRGLILKYLQRAGAAFLVANLIQAACFGIYHGNIAQGIYTFVSGLFFGYVAWRYDSLIPGMFMHFLFNLFGTVGTDIQQTFLPDIINVLLSGLLILGSVPMIAVSTLLIHFRVGETRKEEFIR